MELTPKQEKFAQCIADGMNQSDAYRAAYNAGGMKAETVQNKAHVLMKNGEVRARVDTLRGALAEKALWTREDSVRALKDIACGTGKPNEVVAAVKELNAMHGFNAPVDINLGGKVVSVIERRIVRPTDSDG
jgi:phage terminase small subunit